MSGNITATSQGDRVQSPQRRECTRQGLASMSPSDLFPSSWWLFKTEAQQNHGRESPSGNEHRGLEHEKARFLLLSCLLAQCRSPGPTTHLLVQGTTFSSQNAVEASGIPLSQCYVQTVSILAGATPHPRRKTLFTALAGVAQGSECQSANQKVAGSIPSQGTCLGCRSGPQLGVCKRQPHIDISLPFSLPSPL